MYEYWYRYLYSYGTSGKGGNTENSIAQAAAALPGAWNCIR